MSKILKLEKNSVESNYIKAKDEKLGKLIDYIGDYTIELKGDYFESLARSIVGQQLSVKAAQTIWIRLYSLCENMTPDTIIDLDEESLRSVGISKTKVKYLKNLSQAVIDKVIDLDNMDNLDEDTIIKQLTSVKGIGKWTAEMFLIFTLGKIDIFSIGDLGLKRAMNWIYSEGDDLSNSEIIEITSKWKPYKTIGSLYLWEVLNREINIEYKTYDDFIKYNHIKDLRK